MSFFRGLVKVFASILVVCSLFPCVASATESSMTSRGDSLFDASRAALAGQQLAALSSGDVQAVQASCSHLHTAAVLSDGSLWIWGSVLHLDGFGFSSYNNCTPTKIMDGVSQVSLGQTAGAAVKSNGELWMWGDHNLADYATSSTLDSSGQYVYSSNTLTKVMDGVIQAECSCNADPSFAVLKSDGSLWMWGNNDCGQLGIGSKSRQYAPVKVMDNVSSVSLGECNSAAVKTDGSLWMWGANDNGQLGTGIVDEGTVTPVNVMGGVKEVSLGDGYAAAISSDNSLWWWGCYPHLGGGGSSNSIPESGTASNFSPTRLSSGVSHVSVAGTSAMLINADGTLCNWGFVQTGEYSDDLSYSAEDITDSVAQVSVDSQFAAVKTDGSLWTWGSNFGGQLGDGTTHNRNVPACIFRDGEWQPVEDEFVSLTRNASSTTFTPELAYRLAELAYAAYEDPIQGEGGSDGSYIASKIQDCWFDVVGDPHNYFADPFDPRYGSDTVAFTIAQNDSGDKKVVLVVIRGSYGSLKEMTPDWQSDLNVDKTMLAVGTTGYHMGFNLAAEKVYTQLQSEGLIDSSNTRYVITGHSRGAGVGNLLAVKLAKAGVPQKDIVAYNFACPDTARDLPANWNKDGEFDNIFNVGQYGDPVTEIPGILLGGNVGALGGVTWGKYGQSLWFSGDWEGSNSIGLDKHRPQEYVDYLEGRNPRESYKTWAEMKSQGVSNAVNGILSIFRCPVDVYAKDKNGTVIVSVVDGALSYSDAADGNVIAVTDGDTKWFYAFNGTDVTYDVVARDSGTMQYEVYAVDRLNEAVSGEKSFEDIALEEGKTLSTSVTQDMQVTDARLFVVDSAGNAIAEVAEDGKEESISSPQKTSINAARVALDANAVTFNGKQQTPGVTVTLDGKKLKEGSDYTVAFADNVNAGTATVTVTGKGNYTGKAKVTFKINKAKNPAKFTNKQKTVKLASVKRKAQVVRPLVVKKAQGKVTYAKVAKGSSKKLSVNKKTGKITVKKGTKKGLYKVTVKVKVAGNKNYKSVTKNVTVKVRVK